MTGLLPVIISQYFGRRRTAPTGLSYAGAGIGAFVFPIVFQYLLDSFGLRESCLIMGGLTFLAIFGTLTLSPPPAPSAAKTEATFGLLELKGNMNSAVCYDHQEVIRESNLESCHPASDVSFFCSHASSQGDDETAKDGDGTKSLLLLPHNHDDDDASMVVGDERINATDDEYEERTSRTGYTDCSSSSSLSCSSSSAKQPSIIPSTLCHQRLNLKKHRNTSKKKKSDDGNEGEESSLYFSTTANTTTGIIFQVSHRKEEEELLDKKCYSSPDSTTFPERDDSSEFALLNERSSQQNQEEESCSFGRDEGIPVAVLLADEEKVTQNEREKMYSKKQEEREQQTQRIANWKTQAEESSQEETRSQCRHEITNRKNNKKKNSGSDSKNEDEEAASNLDRLFSERRIVVEKNRRKEEGLDAEETLRNLVDRIWRQILSDSVILTRPHFFLITFTYMAYIMGNVTLLMILPDYVMSLQCSRDFGVFLLSLFSLTDLLGRLLPGWVQWIPALERRFSNKTMYAVSVGVMGVSFFLYPIILSPTTLQTMAMTASLKQTTLIWLTLLCGFVSGCQMILPPVVIADTMGPENTAVAFGLSNFLLGIFSFSRPFIFREYYATHDIMW